MQSIKHWPEHERPREKLLLKGVNFLSDAELLAVLIGRGTKTNDAIAIGRALLNEFGSLRGIVNASKESFCAIAGLGLTRYAQVQAAFEIIRRHLEEPLKQTAVFHNVTEVHNYVRSRLRDEKRELFAMLLLDSQHQLLAYRVMFTGTINAAAVYPRELVKQALIDNAAAVILVHNHPSGVAEPSQADIRITKDIKQALSLIDVNVLDHFVVGDNTATSLAQRGLME